MGLDTSHDCWHGPYSAFRRFREKIAEVAWGVTDCYSDDERFDKMVSDNASDGLLAIVDHSDCDGEIEPARQLALAERLEQIADRLDTGANSQVRGEGFSVAARRFAAGLRAANAAGEAVVFS